MLVTLDAPYADTTAADLGFTLGLPEQPALHVLDLPVTGGGAAVRLRLLGASHQVVLRTSARELVETVACIPGRDADLPSTVDEDAIGYRFTARVLRLDAATMSARVARLCRLAADPYALVGVFPGSPDAVTALQTTAGSDPGTRAGAGNLNPAMIGWRTWHAYPQTGELVATETEVAL